MSSRWQWFGLAAMIVIADQLTKWLVLGYFENRHPREELTGFLNLVLVFNKGAAFSLFAQAGGWQTPLLVVFALIATVIITVMIVRNPGRGMLCLGLALILGGALGNLIDRVRFGHVVDFLDFHALGWHWPAFNVADSAICVGAAILILESFVNHEKRAGAPT